MHTKKELDSVTIEYAMSVMDDDVLSKEEFKRVKSRYRKYNISSTTRLSAAKINTQGLSKAFVVASCSSNSTNTIFSDFSGRKERQIVLKDFPTRKESFKIWYRMDSKPYQHILLFKLINKLLGKIGTKINETNPPIGYCAEQNVANRLLLDSDENIVDFSELMFSVALRPNTGEMIPYCENCKTLFNQLKDEKI